MLIFYSPLSLAYFLLPAREENGNATFLYSVEFMKGSSNLSIVGCAAF
jgi:hypothetical protein